MKYEIDEQLTLIAETEEDALMIEQMHKDLVKHNKGDDYRLQFYSFKPQEKAGTHCISCAYLKFSI